MEKYLIWIFWIFLIPVSYGFLSLLGMACFEISLKLDKNNIELRRDTFNKGFIWMGWLIPVIFIQDLLRGRYKKNKQEVK